MLFGVLAVRNANMNSDNKLATQIVTHPEIPSIDVSIPTRYFSE